MNDTQLSQPTLSAGKRGEPGAPAAVQRPPQAAGDRAGWTGGRIAAVVTGAFLVLISLVLLGAGGTGLWADRTQRDAGYVTTGVHEFSTSRSALATEHTRLGSAGLGWLYSPGLLGKIRIRVTPVSSGSRLFVGIGRSTDVDRYLADVNHTIISDFFGNKVETVAGGSRASAPGTQHFWVASSSGPGARTLKWDPHDGSWTVVAMNADGRAGIDMRADLGARMPAVLWLAVGSLIAGAIFLTGGALLLWGAIRGRGASSVDAGTGAGPDSAGAASTSASTGHERRSDADR